MPSKNVFPLVLVLSLILVPAATSRTPANTIKCPHRRFVSTRPEAEVTGLPCHDLSRWRRGKTQWRDGPDVDVSDLQLLLPLPPGSPARWCSPS